MKNKIQVAAQLLREVAKNTTDATAFIVKATTSEKYDEIRLPRTGNAGAGMVLPSSIRRTCTRFARAWAWRFTSPAALRITAHPLKSVSMTTSKSAHGGARRGAGRPRKGEGLRVGLTLSVSPETLNKARQLRKAGFPLNEHVEDLVDEKHSWYFNE